MPKYRLPLLRVGSAIDEGTMIAVFNSVIVISKPYNIPLYEEGVNG